MPPPPPGELHPPLPRRSALSLAGRAAPRLYSWAWILSLLGLGLLAAAGAGIAGGLTGWPLVALIQGGTLGLAGGMTAAALAQGQQRKADGWQDYFGPSPILATFALLAYSAAASVALLILLRLANLDPSASVVMVVGLLINLAGYLGLTYLLAVRPGAMTWRDIYAPKRLAPETTEWLAAMWSQYRPPARVNLLRARVIDVAAGVGLVLPAILITGMVTLILIVVLGLSSIDTTEEQPAITTTVDIVLALVGVSLIAPIGEEIFFRGFATNAWARSLARTPALLRATLLFASVHVINTSPTIDAWVTLRLAILAIAARLPVSWLLGWLYTNRKSLLASITLHAAYNGALLLIAIWAASQARVGG